MNIIISSTNHFIYHNIYLVIDVLMIIISYFVISKLTYFSFRNIRYISNILNMFKTNNYH